MKDLAIKEFDALINKDVVTRADITRFVRWMQNRADDLGADPFPLYEHLSDGFYRREVHLPAGHVIVGAVHTKESYAIVMRGKVLVIDEDGVREIIGPCTLTQKAGKQKIGLVLEDCIWLDIHTTDAETTEQAYAELFLNSYDDYDRLDYYNVLDEIGMTERAVREITEDISDIVPVPEPYTLNGEIRQSPIEGFGVFAKRRFKNNEIIAPARIGINRTPLGRYTNHSAAPNAVAIVNGIGIDFVAAGNIDIGDEITVNYRQALDAAKELDRRLSCQQ